MRIIHISGSPGSGKTTLGKQLNAPPNIVVIDTDEILTELHEIQLRALRDAELHEQAQNYWVKIMNTKLLECVEQNRDACTLVFVGILNHMSPTGEILEMPFSNVEKYFIDIDRITLLQQFYGRFARLLKEDLQFANDIANGVYDMESSKDYLRQSFREKKWHEEHGYALTSPQVIIELVTKNRKLKQCVVCQNMSQFKCGYCFSRFYCSRECQTTDWATHCIKCNNILK